MKKLPFWGFFLFAVFLVLSALVYLGLNSFDQPATSFLQVTISRKLDVFFSIFSVLGTFEISTLILVLVLVSLKKLNKFTILVGYGAVLVGELLGKSIIPQLPPPIEILRTKVFFSFPTGEVSQYFYAFPSGHSSRTAFIVVVLLLAIWGSRFKTFQKRALVLIILVFAITMFVSRVYLAEHWASDVIGGIFLGSAVGLLTFNLKKG